MISLFFDEQLKLSFFSYTAFHCLFQIDYKYTDSVTVADNGGSLSNSVTRVFLQSVELRLCNFLPRANE